MKINRNSWHYKAAMFGQKSRNDIRENLCDYTEQVLWGMFGFAFCCVMAGVLVAGVGFMLLYLPVKAYLVVESTWWLFTLLPHFVAIGLFSRAYYKETHVDDIPKAVRFLFKEVGWKANKGSSPNIFIEYIKAKKSKFCPRLEFVDHG